MTKNNSRSSSTSSNEGRYKRMKIEDTDSENNQSNENETTNISSNSSSSSSSSSSNIKTQAAFVNKLYKMLQDPTTSNLITWSSLGDLFSVSNPTKFSKTVLPQYFKHNNWQSFVRQLNMYGFHKVNDLIHSNLTNENQTWEFKHPHFKRGAVEDLQNIKRKSAKSGYPQSVKQQEIQENKKEELIEMDSPSPQNDIGMEDNVARIESHLIDVSKSCDLLYKEVVTLKQVVSKQQEAMQDLVDVVSTSKLNSKCVCLKNDAERSSSAFTLVESSTGDNHINNKFNYRPLYKSNERNHSMMSFGKESHMLNPLSDQNGYTGD